MTAPIFPGHLVPRQHVTTRDVVRAVSAEFLISAEDILSERRFRPIAQAVMYLATRVTRASGSEIGRRLNRDHSTVRHGLEAISKRMAKDPQLAARLRRIEDRLRPPPAPEPLALAGDAQLDFLPGPLFDFVGAR